MTRSKYHYWYWGEVPCLMRSTKHELASALGDIDRKWSNCGLIQELGLASSLLMMLSQMYRCLPASLEESRQFAINIEVCCSHNDNILLLCNNCNDMSFVFLLLFFFTPISILVVNSSKVILIDPSPPPYGQPDWKYPGGFDAFPYWRFKIEKWDVNKKTGKKRRILANVRWLSYLVAQMRCSWIDLRIALSWQMLRCCLKIFWKMTICPLERKRSPQ